MALTSYSQGTFQYCTCINNIWGEWDDLSPHLPFRGAYFIMKVNDREYIIYHQREHPSNYIMRIKAYSDMVDNDKKSRKQHYKSKEDYELKGEVEIFTDTETFIKGFPFQCPTHDRPEMRNNVMKATIKIAPYKERPQVFNIWFGNYGLAIATQ